MWHESDEADSAAAIPFSDSCKGYETDSADGHSAEPASACLEFAAGTKQQRT